MPKIFKNGITREMTQEEIAEYQRLSAEFSPPEPTPEERIKDLEEKLKAAEILLGLEV